MGLFPHYPADPGAVHTSGDDAIRHGTSFGTLRTDLQQAGITAQSTVSGSLHGPVVNSVTPLLSRSSNLAQAANICGGALHQFAGAITTYNHGIDKLNAEYASAKAADFNVDPDQFYDHGDQTAKQRQAAYDGAVKRAGSALVFQLTQRKNTLDSTLDDSANEVSTMLDQGPSASTLIKLVLSGDLPLDSANLFPGVDIANLATALRMVKLAAKLGMQVPNIKKLIDAFSTAKDFSKTCTELAAAESKWTGILDAIEKDGTGQTLKALATSIKSEDDINYLTYAKMFSQYDKETAGLKLAQGASAANYGDGALSAIRSSGGRVLSIAGLATNSYDLYSLFAHGDDGRGTTDSILRATGDTAGLVSSGGSLYLSYALAAGAVAPEALPVIVIGAGLVAGGIAVYRNWGTISHGLSTAYDWTKNQVEGGLKSDWHDVESAGSEAKKAGKSIWDHTLGAL